MHEMLFYHDPIHYKIQNGVNVIIHQEDTAEGSVQITGKNIHQELKQCEPS